MSVETPNPSPPLRPGAGPSPWPASVPPSPSAVAPLRDGSPAPSGQPSGPFDALARSCASARGGYAWWYIEAHDLDEGRYGLTLIVFAGSVFSPHYAGRLRRGDAVCGLDYPAVHFALYERPSGGRHLSHGRLWVMNEYPASAFFADAHEVRVGGTRLHYREGGLDVEIDEHTTRFFSKPGGRVQARLRIQTDMTMGTGLSPFCLGENAAGEAHFWQPIAPAATVEVEVKAGGLSRRFAGHSYCDRNCGSGPLHGTFRRWFWAHGVSAGQKPGALVLYQAQRLDDSVLGLSVRYPAQPHPAPDGGAQVSRDEHGGWGGGRGGLADFLWLRVPPRFTVADYQAERARGSRLEDAPFYARYAAELGPAGEHAVSSSERFFGVGEYLDLERFRSPAVQHLLTFKTRVVEAAPIAPAPPPRDAGPES